MYQNTENKSLSDGNTNKWELMLSSKCDMCDNKKLRVIKYQEASGLIKNLRLRASLIKILLLLSDCLICTRNSMSIVLLLQMVGGWLI